MGKAWSNQELEVLEKHWVTGGYNAVKDMLKGRSRTSIQSKAQKIGLKCNALTWTEEEDNIIREYWGAKGYNGVKDLLPRRTRGSITCRAKLLGVKFESNAWTEEEIRLLKKLYPVTKTYELVDILGRHINQINNKVSDLGLRKDRSWSQEDDEFIINKFRIKSTDYIARKLDRAVYAVEKRAEELGLLRFRELDDEGYIPSYEVARMLGLHASTLRRYCNMTPRSSKKYRRNNVTKYYMSPYQILLFMDSTMSWVDRNFDLRTIELLVLLDYEVNKNTRNKVIKERIMKAIENKLGSVRWHN